MKTLIPSLFSLLLFQYPQARSQAFQAFTPPENIKTVRLINPADTSAAPTIQKRESLILSFDDLRTNPQAYRYTLIRYDRDWKVSKLFQSEYKEASTALTYQSENHPGRPTCPTSTTRCASPMRTCKSESRATTASASS